MKSENTVKNTLDFYLMHSGDIATCLKTTKKIESNVLTILKYTNGRVTPQQLKKFIGYSKDAYDYWSEIKLSGFKYKQIKILSYDYKKEKLKVAINVLGNFCLDGTEDIHNCIIYTIPAKYVINPELFKTDVDNLLEKEINK